MENTKTVLKNEIHIAGTVVSMRMEERGNCILVIRSNAERQIRNIQLRFYDINQAIIFRVDRKSTRLNSSHPSSSRMPSSA